MSLSSGDGTASCVAGGVAMNGTSTPILCRCCVVTRAPCTSTEKGLGARPHGLHNGKEHVLVSGSGPTGPAVGLKARWKLR